MTEQEGRRLAALPKRAIDRLVWVARRNHAGSAHCVAVLVGIDGATLPGLTVALEVKAPVVVQVMQGPNALH